MLLPLLSARADLKLVQQSLDTNAPFQARLWLKGDKMRLEQQENTNGSYAVIIDLQTRDSWTLLPHERKYLKRSGADILKSLALDLKLFGRTNENLQMPALAQDTGRAEPVNGYNTEVFIWHGTHGLTQTLWVAKGFSDFENIRPELARLDHFNLTGPHPNAQPELSPLPGMVVQSEQRMGAVTKTVKLISARIEPVDAALFQLPADYTLWVPPAKPPRP